MYCESCGALITDNATTCASCGGPVGASNPAPVYQRKEPATPVYDVPNYMTRAIVVTILFCWPFGIPAIVNAVESRTKLADGDHAGALESAQRSKMWSNVSIGVGIASWVLLTIYIIVLIASVGSTAMDSLF